MAVGCSQINQLKYVMHLELNFHLQNKGGFQFALYKWTKSKNPAG